MYKRNSRRGGGEEGALSCRAFSREKKTHDPAINAFVPTPLPDRDGLFLISVLHRSGFRFVCLLFFYVCLSSRRVSSNFFCTSPRKIVRVSRPLQSPNRFSHIGRVFVEDKLWSRLLVPASSTGSDARKLSLFVCI